MAYQEDFSALIVCHKIETYIVQVKELISHDVYEE